MEDTYPTLVQLLDLASEIASIAGVIGIIVAVFTYRKAVRDTDKAEQIQLMHNSIEVINIFTDSFAPQIPSYRQRMKIEYTKKRSQIITTNKRENPSFTVSSISHTVDRTLKQQAQLKANVGNLFNKLEQICTYIRSDLILDDIVYPVLHYEFLEFINSNEESLTHLTTPSKPYTGIHFTISKWQAQTKHDTMKQYM